MELHNWCATLARFYGLVANIPVVCVPAHLSGALDHFDFREPKALPTCDLFLARQLLGGRRLRRPHEHLRIDGPHVQCPECARFTSKRNARQHPALLAHQELGGVTAVTVLAKRTRTLDFKAQGTLRIRDVCRAVLDAEIAVACARDIGFGGT